MGDLRLTLLGPLEIRHDQHTIEFPDAKALALFIYIMVEPGPHTHKKLLSFFWPLGKQEQAEIELNARLDFFLHEFHGSSYAQQIGHLFVEDDHIGNSHAANTEIDIYLLQKAIRGLRETDIHLQKMIDRQMLLRKLQLEKA